MGPDAWLREHLRTCRDCAALAAAVLAGNAALDGTLAQLTGTRGAGGAVRPAAAVYDTARPAGVARRRLPRWPAALVPLAAAAALLLVLNPALTTRAPLPPLPAPAEAVPATPVVNAVGASGVAVMRTSNPSITVVWTF
jgi:hypothetical protein